jgi:hypothetical protein
MDMTLNIKNKILILIIFCIFCITSCNNQQDSSIIGKYETKYIIHWSSHISKEYTIYTNDSVYTCSFQGTNFILEKNNTNELFSTTAPIEIIKSEIVK